eukprot:1010572_1
MTSFSYTIIIGMIFTMTVHGDSDCARDDHCAAECNQVYTGLYEDDYSTYALRKAHEYVYFWFNSSKIQKVTFTNCGSIDLFSAILTLNTCTDSSGLSCIDDFTSQSDG